MTTLAHSGGISNISSRILYALLFVLVLPIGLIAWAHATASAIGAAPIHAPIVGAAFALAGILLTLTAMLALWHRGGGLPMNAFPPPRFVTSGIYSLVPHPIYIGFILTCAGISISAGSASGLYLVTPAVALACSALVLGYELPDLRRRFGPPSQSLWLPSADHPTPTMLERARILVVILLPWLAFFELLGYFGPAPDAIPTWLPFEMHWPVFDAAEPLYFSVYVAVILAPLLIRSTRQLRRFAQLGLSSMAIVFPAFLLLPFYAPPRPFQPTTIFAPMLAWERTPISAVGAIPSYHIVWTLIVATTLSTGSLPRRILIWAWAVLACASCIATGMHSVADVITGVATFLLLLALPRIWAGILRIAETLANSWQEWRLGPVRVISHGAYGGVAACVEIFLIHARLQGQFGNAAAILAVSVCCSAIIGAALWAQWVEGSPSLLRPLGFYGGMIGAILGGLPALALNINLWQVFAAICIAAPWMQALGRVRCLVQGCCHGAPTHSAVGIHYTHPRSRVCRLAHLAGVSVHATPVYSILSNVVIGLALARAAQIHVSAAFLCGLYMLLSGCARFVEEAYRGEPQTRIVAGLRFYQWIAIVSVVAGAVLTGIRHTAPLPALAPTPTSAALGLFLFLLAWFVTGVDFPESNRRFARLT